MRLKKREEQKDGRNTVMARNKYDVDESLESKFDAKQLKRLYSYVGPYKGKLLFVIFLMLISSRLKVFT